MTTTRNLYKSITELTDDELRKRMLDIRANRRSVRAQKSIETKKKVKAKPANISTEQLISQMSEEQQDALYKKLMESRNE